MLLQSLSLSHFRNHTSRDFNFSPRLSIIVGKNTSGKSNVLEALHLLTFGKSRRPEKEEELIQHSHDTTNIIGRFQNLDDFKLQVIYYKNPGDRLQKKYLLNGVSKSHLNFIGHFFSVFFSPDDLQLISGAPGIRRLFLNTVLVQTDSRYKNALVTYEKTIRARNAILERIKNGQAHSSELTYWNHVAIENGNYITHKREEFINFIVGEGFSTFPKGFAEGEPQKLRVLYDRSEISADRLAQYAQAEIASTVTLVGPHRDDLQFFDGDRNLKSFGSRGEQRLLILSLKLKELQYLEKETHSAPVLLLDDIFSELDPVNRKHVLNLIENYQTVLTTADEKDLEVLSLGVHQKIYL